MGASGYERGIFDHGATQPAGPVITGVKPYLEQPRQENRASISDVRLHSQTLIPYGVGKGSKRFRVIVAQAATAVELNQKAREWQAQLPETYSRTALTKGSISPEKTHITVCAATVSYRDELGNDHLDYVVPKELGDRMRDKLEKAKRAYILNASHLSLAEFTPILQIPW